MAAISNNRKKTPYNHNNLTDFEEIWHGFPSLLAPDWALKIDDLANLRWQMFSDSS